MRFGVEVYRNCYDLNFKFRNLFIFGWIDFRERERLSKNQEELESIRQANSDLEHDMEKCHAKENELLEFTRKLTEKNVNLQSDYTALRERVFTIFASILIYSFYLIKP